MWDAFQNLMAADMFWSAVKCLTLDSPGATEIPQVQLGGRASEVTLTFTWSVFKKKPSNSQQGQTSPKRDAGKEPPPTGV